MQTKRARCSIRLTLILLLFAISILSYGCAKERSPSETVAAGIVNKVDAPAPQAQAASLSSSESQATAAPFQAQIAAAPSFSEIMPQNRSALRAGDGQFYPWVELINNTEEPVQMQNYCLSLQEKEPAQWRFPSLLLLPGQRHVVFLSGQNSTEGEFHSPLTLTEEYTALYLYTAEGVLVDRIAWVFPAIGNLAIVKNGNATYYTAFATPGQENDPRALPESIPAVMNENDPVVINELLQQNKNGWVDQDGDASGWVELYNRSMNPVSLLGYALSVDINDPVQWLFPDITIAPGQYLLVYLSGKQHREGELHASILPDPSSPVVTLTELSNNRMDFIPTVPEISPVFAVGRMPDNTFRVFAESTPGQQNEGLTFDAYRYYLLTENQIAE